MEGSCCTTSHMHTDHLCGVSIHGRLLAIGGRDLDLEPTSAVHMYIQPNH